MAGRQLVAQIQPQGYRSQASVPSALLAASKTVPPYKSNCQEVRGCIPFAASMAVNAVIE